MKDWTRSEAERERVLREMVQEEFEAWRKMRSKGIELANRDEESTFVNAHAMANYLALAQRDAMGRELDKLQQRIHRQRVANRELIERLEQTERRRDQLVAKWLERQTHLDRMGSRHPYVTETLHWAAREIRSGAHHEGS